MGEFYLVTTPEMARLVTPFRVPAQGPLVREAYNKKCSASILDRPVREMRDGLHALGWPLPTRFEARELKSESVQGCFVTLRNQGGCRSFFDDGRASHEFPQRQVGALEHG
jgi:hypothetical protein